MLKIIAAAASAAVIASAAQAQDIPTIIDRAGDVIRLPDRTIDVDGPIETASAAGCILSQTYNTQSVDDFSVQFRISTSSGPEMFNVLVPNIKKANPSSFPLANASQTLRWTRLLDTFERAAMTDRPVTVSYETVSRNVFGISIDWSRRCVS